MSVCAMRDKKGELLFGRHLATPALLDRGNVVESGGADGWHGWGHHCGWRK